jgi:hypothetical protein
MEDFAAMPRRTQLFYIASEIYEGEDPCRPENLMLRGRRK